MKRKFTVMFLCLILGLVACGKESEENVPVSGDNVPVTGVEILKEDSVDENINDEEGWSASGLSQSLPNSAVPMKNGTALPGLTVVGEDSPYYCNVEENLRGGEDTYHTLLLVCKDPVYDITYYVNYGEDYFIYAKQKDSVTCVLEIPANRLYCREGVLYFAVESFDKFTFEGMEQGNILKYNPVDGTVEVVVGKDTERMVVYPDGITYDISTLMETREDGIRVYFTKRHFYSFETGETVECENLERQLRRWKEYWLVEPKEGGVYLEDCTGEKVRDLVDMEELPRWYYIKDDSMYYQEITTGKGKSKTTLVIYDFETGEKTEIVLARDLGMSDFMPYKDVMYFGRRFRVSLQDGKQYDVDFSKGYEVETLYSDGESMYCIFNGKLWRLEEEQVDETGREITSLKGLPVVTGCYEYILYEPEQ